MLLELVGTMKNVRCNPQKGVRGGYHKGTAVSAAAGEGVGSMPHGAEVDQTKELFDAIAAALGDSSPKKIRARYERLTSGEGSSQCTPNLDE